MTLANCDNAALMAGFTMAVIGDNAQGLELALLVKPETDLDSSFIGFDTDSQEWLTVHGWLFSFEIETL